MHYRLMTRYFKNILAGSSASQTLKENKKEQKCINNYQLKYIKYQLDK